MYWLKECPRCKVGDIVLDKDMYGWYRSCVQCGFHEDLPADNEFELAMGKANRKNPLLKTAA